MEYVFNLNQFCHNYLVCDLTSLYQKSNFFKNTNESKHDFLKNTTLFLRVNIYNKIFEFLY